MESHQVKNNQQSEEMIHRMGENICKLLTLQEINNQNTQGAQAIAKRTNNPT